MILITLGVPLPTILLHIIETPHSNPQHANSRVWKPHRVGTFTLLWPHASAMSPTGRTSRHEGGKWMSLAEVPPCSLAH
jgi:hypothetical protein